MALFISIISDAKLRLFLVSHRLWQITNSFLRMHHPLFTFIVILLLLLFRVSFSFLINDGSLFQGLRCGNGCVGVCFGSGGQSRVCFLKTALLCQPILHDTDGSTALNLDVFVVVVLSDSSESSFCTETKECLLYDSVCKGDDYEVNHFHKIHLHQWRSLVLLVHTV